MSHRQRLSKTKYFQTQALCDGDYSDGHFLVPSGFDRCMSFRQLPFEPNGFGSIIPTPNG